MKYLGLRLQVRDEQHRRRRAPRSRRSCWASDSPTSRGSRPASSRSSCSSTLRSSSASPVMSWPSHVSRSKAAKVTRRAGRNLGAAGAPLVEGVEVRDAVLVQDRELAVDDVRAALDAGQGCRHLRVRAGAAPQALRPQLGLAMVDAGNAAPAVVLELVEPFGISAGRQQLFGGAHRRRKCGHPPTIRGYPPAVLRSRSTIAFRISRP